MVGPVDTTLGSLGDQHARSMDGFKEPAVRLWSAIQTVCCLFSHPGLSWRMHLCTLQYWRSLNSLHCRSPHHPQRPHDFLWPRVDFSSATMTDFHDPKVVQADASAPLYLRHLPGIF